jgi:hypothetical protein
MTAKHKIKGRLFTFGCSFTSYGWPTWADILGREANSFENWARPSAGNHHILVSLAECLNKNKVTSDDTIIILYSGISRIDFYQKNSWDSILDKNFLDHPREPISCPDGFELINFSYFYLIDQLLSSLNLNYHTFKWMKYNTNTKAGILYQDVIKKIKYLGFPMKKKKIWKGPEFSDLELYDKVCDPNWPKYEEIYNYDRRAFDDTVNSIVDSRFLSCINNHKQLYTYSKVIDVHPSPREHLEAIEEYFYISDETKKWAIQMDEDHLNGIENPFNKNLATRF